MDFEYAIKMDVRNNPIVREIDRSRQRELWRSVAIGVGLVVVVLFSLWQRFAVIRTGTEIERMQHELQEEQVVNRQLQLQTAQLSSPRRIAKLAAGKPLLHGGAGSAEHVDSRTGDGHAAAFVFGRGRAVTRGEQR